MGIRDPRSLIFAPELEAALADVPGQADALEAARGLRRALGPEGARVAGELRELRQRAEGRLPEAARLALTRKGLEQATHGRLARVRAGELARRAAERTPRPWILDGTCGLGSDAAALARTGLRVLAADADPFVARCARHNLGVWGLPARVVAARAEAPGLRLDGAPGRPWLLLDPDRRVEGRREGDPERWSPRWSDALALFQRFGGSVVKLAPGTGTGSLDASLPPELPRSWTWTSLDGELKEVALWLGEAALPGVERAAWVLRGEDQARLGGPAVALARPGPLDSPAEARFLADPDPAVLAAGLLPLLAERAGLSPLGPESVYLGGPREPTPAARPFLRSFRVLGAAPLDRRRIKALLAAHDVGPLTVKKRALPESADDLARRFRGRGAKPGLLVCTRLGTTRQGYLVEPIPTEGENRTSRPPGGGSKGP